jgi:hypothetical protein
MDIIGLEALHASLGNEAADPVLGARPHHRQICDAAVRNPALGPV